MKGSSVAAAVAVVAMLFASCSKDKESGSIRFERAALYLAAGESETVSFSIDNVQAGKFSVTSKPEGWEDISVDAAARTLTVTAPAVSDDDTATSGSVVLTGVSSGDGSIVSATLFVGIAPTVDLSERPANSYLVAGKETCYLFDAMHKGDGRSALATERVSVIWQSAAGLVQYLQLVDGKASFYIGADSDDDTRIKEGNALVGAYDAGGNLLWSWHIWVSDYDPDSAGGSVELNGHTMMTRNLGARADSDASEDEILASYGLYYQWGRKEPFIGPLSYDAANGSSAALYDRSGSRIYLTVAAADAETGTMEYAVRNPLTYLTVSEKDADWLQETSAVRWSEDAKTLYDPCPYGWRVAPAAALRGLTIADDLHAEGADYASKYGWTLTDGSGSSLFMGAGRRSWRDASVQNYFDDSLLSRVLEMQPWVGYYWTGAADGSLASAFCFWLKADEVAASGVRPDRPMGRANGMQVRCVRAE
ncbi:MAG: hypothetical protein NC209_04995 [Alistipes sp.]|nr:hypothetical protein [Alistipes senegalensis]MCM1250480.1 hypothetical protein [Alistipes sp.]